MQQKFEETSNDWISAEKRTENKTDEKKQEGTQLREAVKLTIEKKLRKKKYINKYQLLLSSVFTPKSLWSSKSLVILFTSARSISAQSHSKVSQKLLINFGKTSSIDTFCFNSLDKLVTPLPMRPQGTILSNQVKSVLQFKAKPWVVMKRLPCIPMAQIWKR